MNKISRRQAIGLGAAAMASTLLPRSSRAANSDGLNNIGRQLIPWTIVNNSGSTEPAYLYMFGVTNPEVPNFNTYYLSKLNGDCTLFPYSTTGKTYGLKLTGKTVNAFFPQLDAVRIYISFGKELVVDTNENAIPGAISADTPSPNYHTLWDFVEATWHNYQTYTILHVNVTQVDAFGIAFKNSYTGFDPANMSVPLEIISGFDSDTARAGIFSDLKKVGAPWSDLIISSGGSPLRALMPLKSMDLGVFPKNQMKHYVEQVVAYYDVANTGNRLIFPYSVPGVGAVTFTGYTEGGSFVFTPDNSSASTYTIAAPTTRECYAQNIFSIPNDSTGLAIGAALGASLVRATLMYYPDAGFPVPQQDRSLYYTEPPICEYAKIIHSYGINNHAFCYGYDEVAGDAGINRDVANPTSFTLTINGL